MRGRLIVLLISTAGISPVAGCDGEPRTPAAATTTRDVEPQTRRIALLGVPLTAEVPPTWDVRRGPGGSLVLSGRAPSGDREIAISVGPHVATSDLPATQPATPTTPGGPASVRVDDRDAMRVVERIERVGPADVAAELAPVRWTFRFIVSTNGIEQPSYDLSVSNLTQLTFERDQGAVRDILDTIRPADPTVMP